MVSFIAFALVVHSARAEQPALSKLPLTLVGTIIRAEEEKSLGTVRLSSGATEAYHVKDKISTLATVTKFEREKIIFVNLANKKTEYLRIPDFDPKKAASAKAIDDKSGPKELQVPRKFVDEVISDLNKFLQQASSEPVIGSNGQIAGFRLAWIQPGSVWEKLGLKEKDTISAVNGAPITSLQAAVEIYAQLKNSSMIRLKIERDKRETEITYLIR